MTDTQNKQFELGEETKSEEGEWSSAGQGSNGNEREDDRYIYYRKSVDPTQGNLRAAGEIEERIRRMGLMNEDEYNGNETDIKNISDQIIGIENEENDRSNQIKTLKSEAGSARTSANKAREIATTTGKAAEEAGRALNEAKIELEKVNDMSTKTKVESNNLTFEQFINLEKAYYTSYEMAKNGSVSNDKEDVFGQALNKLNENNKSIGTVFNLVKNTWGVLGGEKGNASLSDVAKKIVENGSLKESGHKSEAEVLKLLSDKIDVASTDIEAANAINAEANILRSRRFITATRGDIETISEGVSENGLFKGDGLILGGKDSKTYMQDTAKENGQEKSIKGYEKYTLSKCDDKDKRLNQYEEDLKNNLMKNYLGRNVKGEVKSIDATVENVNNTLKYAESDQTRLERMRKEFEKSKDFKGNPYNIPEGEDLNKCIDYLKKKRESNDEISFMSSLTDSQQQQYSAIKSKIEEEEEERKDGKEGKLSDREYANLLYIYDCFVRSANVAKNIESVKTNMSQFGKNIGKVDGGVVSEGIKACGDSKYTIGVFKLGEDGLVFREKDESISTTKIVKDSNTDADRTIEKPLTQINNNLQLMEEGTDSNLTALYNLAMGDKLRVSKSDAIKKINDSNSEFDNYSILDTRLGSMQNFVQRKSVEIGKSTVEIEDEGKANEKKQAIDGLKETIKRLQTASNQAEQEHKLAETNASKLEAEAKSKEGELAEAQEKQKQINQTKSELETKRDELNATIKEEDKKREQAEKLKKEAEDLRKTQYEYTKREKKEVPETTKVLDNAGGGDVPSGGKILGKRSGDGDNGGNKDGNTENGNNKIHIGMADGTGDAIEGWNGGIDYMANLYSRLALNDPNSTTRAGIYVSNIEQANRELVDSQMSFIRQSNLTLGQAVETFYNGQNISRQEELLSLINSYPNTSINDLMNAGLLSQDNVRSLLESSNNDLARAGGQALNQGRQTLDEYNKGLTANTEASHSATITATYFQANGGDINLRDVINDDANLENRLSGLENNFNDINSKSSIVDQVENIGKKHPEYTKTMTNRVKYGEKINKFNNCSHYKSGNNLDPKDFSEGYKKATEAVGVYMVYDGFQVKAVDPKNPNSPAEVTIQAEGVKSKLKFESKHGPLNMTNFANESGRFGGCLAAFIKTQERNIQNKGGEEAKNALVCSMDESFKIGDTSLKNASDEELQEFIRNVAAQDGKWTGAFPPSTAKDLGMHINDPKLGARIIEAAKKNMIEENKKKDKDKQLTDEQIEQQCAAIEQSFWQGREERNNYIARNQLQGYNTEMPVKQRQTSQQSVQQPQQTSQSQQQTQYPPAQKQSNQRQHQPLTTSNNDISVYDKDDFKEPNMGTIPKNPRIQRKAKQSRFVE